jgi:transposase
MSNLFWLTDAQMVRLAPFFSKSNCKPRMDDRRVLSGIIAINRNDLRWCDEPKDYGLRRRPTTVGSDGARRAFLPG